MTTHKLNKNQAVNKLIEASSLANVKIAEQLETKETEWYCECQFGTYHKKENLIHCACHWKSHSPTKGGWLPKDRMVTPEQCDRCNERIAKFLEKLDKEQPEREQLAKVEKLPRSQTYTF